jgi:hypothetical protein
MLSPSSPPQANQLAVSISCPKCGEGGLAAVEKTSYPGEYTREFTFVTLPDSLYQRLAKLAPCRVETVCRKCGGLLPPRIYEGEALLHWLLRQAARDDFAMLDFREMIGNLISCSYSPDLMLAPGLRNAKAEGRSKCERSPRVSAGQISESSYFLAQLSAFTPADAYSIAHA